MSEASRLPLVVMVGLSLLVHGLFISGLPQLFDRPPDIFRLTRYVVRFAKPVPTPVPTLTQVAVAEPIPIEPAPVEPVPDQQTPKPIERVETRPQARREATGGANAGEARHSETAGTEKAPHHLKAGAGCRAAAPGS